MRRSVGRSGSVSARLRQLHYATWIEVGLLITGGMGGSLLLLGRSPRATWFAWLLPVLILLGLAGWLLLQYLYFGLVLKTVEQRALQQRFPQAHREVADLEGVAPGSGWMDWTAHWTTSWSTDWSAIAQVQTAQLDQQPKPLIRQRLMLQQFTSARLLEQPSRWLIRQALARSFKFHLRQVPIALESVIAALRLLAHFDLARASKIVAPRLLQLPPVLQLESLAIMTASGIRQPALGTSSCQPAHQQRLQRHRLRQHQKQHRQIQHNLLRVQALMTPLASPDVFAAALRYCLYLGPSPSPEALKVYMQSNSSAAARAVTVAFVLNQLHTAKDAVPDQTGSVQTSSVTARLRPQAEQQLRAMLSDDLQAERQAASSALKDLTDLSPFQTEISALLEDFSPQVRKAVLTAISQTRSQSLYPYLLKALRSPLTEALAQEALLLLQDEAVPLLQRCIRHPDLSLSTKAQSWQVLTAIGTDLAHVALAEDVICQQGKARSRLLSLLWEQIVAQREDNRAALLTALAGADGAMQLVREELWLLSHCYSALVELHPRRLPGSAAKPLRQALLTQQQDISERILILLQIRYPIRRFAPIVRLLRDRTTRPQGLKRLARILEPPLKAPLLAVFSALSAADKRAAFQGWEGNRDCSSPERLRQLIALEPGLAPDSLACAYNLALEQEIALSDDAILRGLDHAHSEVQAAAAAYLDEMPDRMVNELLRQYT